MKDERLYVTSAVSCIEGQVVCKSIVDSVERCCFYAGNVLTTFGCDVYAKIAKDGLSRF